MVITRRRSTPESPQTPVLVHETQEDVVKDDWSTSPIKRLPKLLPVVLLNNTSSSTGDAYYPHTRQRTAKLQKTLKTLVSELTEESLIMLLKLAGQGTTNSIRLGQKVEQVFRLLQGEDSVVRELCSVGIFPTWPCDMVNSCDEENAVAVEEQNPSSTTRHEYLTQVEEEGSVVFRANICQGEKIGQRPYSLKSTLFEEEYELHSTSRRTSSRKRARSKTRINHGLVFNGENISRGV